MLIDRRSFMQAAALLAVGELLSLSPNVAAYASPISNPVPPQMAAGGANTKDVIKIDGWDRLRDSADDEVFIRINQAWRTAWR
jgi:hypothetical protein